MKTVTATPGMTGFDANVAVSARDAFTFVQKGFTFVVRYVGRRMQGHNDITENEMTVLTSAGLGVMLVQHVELPGWNPQRALGVEYGANAAQFADDARYPKGATLWCDLESVNENASASAVIEFCNAWYAEVAARGYEPGLYVGYGSGLTPTQLYSKLKFKRYWSAYNLNSDQFPAVRGVQMKQLPYPGPHNVPVGFEYDVDVIHADAMGDTPTMARRE